MDSKKINLIWIISLFVTGVTSMIFIGAHFVEIALSDMVVRICGVIELVSLSIFTFSTVKKANIENKYFIYQKICQRAGRGEKDGFKK